MRVRGTPRKLSPGQTVYVHPGAFPPGAISYIGTQSRYLVKLFVGCSGFSKFELKGRSQNLDQFFTCCCGLVSQSCLTLCNPMDRSPQRSSVNGFFRQEYQSGLPCPPPGDLPNPGIKLGSPALQVDSLPAELPGKPLHYVENNINLKIISRI